MKYLLLMLPALLAWQATFGQKVQVSGRVTNEDGAAAAYVQIIGNGGESGAEADDNGYYKIELSVRDTVTIVFRGMDYKELTRTLIRPTQPMVTLDVQLVSQAVTLGVVTVTDRFSQREEQNTVSLATVTTKRLDQMSSTSIVNAMQLVPGVTLYDSQPSIRGSSGYTFGAGSRVMGLLNGVPMITADRNSVNFDMMPTDNIKQVEVFKGASSVMYGAGAMGGVINVITDDPGDTPRTVVRIRGLAYDRPANKDADWDGRSSALSASMHFFHSRRIGENYDLSVQTDLINNTGYRKDEFSKRVRVLVMNKYRFKGKLSGLSIGLNMQYSRDSSAKIIAFGGYPQQALIAGPGFFSYQLLKYFSVDPSVTYLAGKTIFEYKGRIFNQRNEISTGQSGTATLWYNDLLVKRNFMEDRLQLVGGVNFTQNSVHSDSTFGQALGNQLAAFLQAKFVVNKRLSIVGGVRYQYEVMRGDTSVKYLAKKVTKGDGPPVTFHPMNDPIFRLGLNYRPLVATYLRTSFGQALRSPCVGERFTTTQTGSLTIYPSGNLQIERGWSAEVGVRQLFKFGAVQGFVDVAAFTMQYQNLVEFWVDYQRYKKVPGVPLTGQNISSASINGGEISYYLETKLSGPLNFTLNGGVTYVDPIDKDGDPAQDGDAKAFDIASDALNGHGQDKPRTLKYRNKWLVRNSFDVHYKSVTFTTNFTYNSHLLNVDKIFLLALPDAYVYRDKDHDGWYIFDFILAYRIQKHIASFHVFNALNEEYMTIPGTMGEQRSFAMQWKFEF